MFKSRATAAEYLDRPDCDPALAAASYRFMETVNRRFGGIRVVRRFLAAEAAGRTATVPLRILDLGSGSCDIPLAVSRWAREHGIPLHFTCLEMAGHAIDMARRRLAQAEDPLVHLLQEDAFTHQPAEPYDYAVASMCFHHFSNVQILTLLQRLRGFVRTGVLINDLRRSRLSALAAQLLLAVSGTPAGVRHDALLSIRRGFKSNELKTLLRQLDRVTVTVEPAWWFRVAAVIRFESGENSISAISLDRNRVPLERNDAGPQSCRSSAPTGRSIPAQGIALGKQPPIICALKGRDIIPARTGLRVDIFRPFRALSLPFFPFPGRCPGLVYHRAFSAPDQLPYGTGQENL